MEKIKTFLYGVIFLIIFIIVFILSNNVIPTAVFADNDTYTVNPVITILTHGLGGAPKDWSNNGYFSINGSCNQTQAQSIRDDYYSNTFFDDLNFEYAEGSLIERLRNLYGDAVVYVVSPNGNNDPYIDKFTYSASNTVTHYAAEAVVLSDMDFSKHSILVYNSGDDFEYEAADVYSRFKTAINKVVTAYYNANNGIYPKMNLIGHSRGTVVNLKYATEYPDRVDSMFALGGIFDSPALARILETPLVGNILNSLSGNLAETAQNMRNSEFIKEIGLVYDDDFFTQLKNEWNENTSGKNIKAYAVSSSFSLGYIKKLLLYSNEILPETKSAIQGMMDAMLKQSVNNISDEMISGLLVGFILSHYGIGLTVEQTASISTFYESIYNSALNLIPISPMDGFLECSVQSAVGYNHFSVYNRCFGYESEMGKRSLGGWEIPHNLEAQDKTIIDFIVGTIGQTRFYYTVENNNTISIDTIVSMNDDISIDIPSQIEGKTVTKIKQGAGTDNFHRASDATCQVTTINIPATVTEIGTGAFQNCTNLTSVTFAPGSQLTTIYAYAFAGCTNLTSIDLPNSVTTIYEYAFADTGLTSCNLKNVSSLGYGVFSECHALTSFSKNSGNGSLTIESGKVVYGCSSSQLLAYACGNTGTSFTIPNSVTIIGEGAFKGANHLTSVTFPSSLSEVRFSAFENCTGLTSIELPGTVTDIGAFAFCGCYNLTSVRMFSTGNIAIGMGAFTGTDTVGFTVPYARIDYYKQTAGLSPYESQVTAITYQISYVTYNGQSIDPTTVYYGVAPIIVDHNTLTRPGYAIAGWYLSTLNGNGTGTAFNASMPYTTKDNTTLYAMWVQMSEGNVSYDANATGFTGVMDNSNVEYNGTLTIPACSFVRPGYECVGWATTPNGNVVYQSGHTYTFALTSPLTLYAKWTPITYSITYNVNNATGGTGSLRNYYTVENNYTFPAVSRTGYVFYGWVLVGNEDGIVLENTVGYSENITMRAEWEITYSLGTNSPTTISSTASILDFSGCSSGLYVNKTFTLTRLVDSITLKNINNLQNLSFDIDNGRSCRIKLIFDNVSFTGRPGCPAIKAISVNLDVYVKTNTTIHGGTSYMPIHNIQLEDVVNMASGITFYHMSVYRYPGMNNLPILTVHGGNGANGASGETGSPNGNNNQNGGSGSDGENGCMGAFGLFGTGLTVNEYVTLMAFGGDGGNGGNGGRGGKGGNATASVGYGAVGVTGMDGGNGGSGGRGGDGVYAACIIGNVTVSAQAAAYFQSGKGGDGGNGGEGGTGGKGGNGGDGKFGVHAGRGGTGGDGGYGGFGGDGGDTATDGIVYFSKNGDLYNYHGLTGSGGSGGAKGSGGDGGRGGKKWPTNNYAETGYTGSAGQNGYAGHNGHLQ